MTPSWPPSPFVEDEDAALAREHGFQQVLPPKKNEDPPTGSRGAVDQYPIILDATTQASLQNDESTSATENGNRSVDSHSSDESHGPATPTAINSEQRFVFLPQETRRRLPEEPIKHVSRSKSSSHLNRDEVPRGRPVIPPVNTSVGGEIDGMTSKRRQPTSPYASQSKQEPSATHSGKLFSGESFLSPQHTQESQRAPTHDYRRAASTGPRVKGDDTFSSTDSERQPERRGHVSRRRSRRESGPRSERPSLEKLVPATSFDKRSVSYNSILPTSSILSRGLQGQGQREKESTDTNNTKHPVKDSPYSSAAEDRKLNRDSRNPPDRKFTRESPYTSSAEESVVRSGRVDPASSIEGRRSRRGSTLKKQRPRLDISGQHYSYGGGELPDEKSQRLRQRPDLSNHPIFDGRNHLGSASVQSPQAMEDYLERAFKDDRWKKSNRTPRASPMASPFTSPPRSPPRTPRSDRRSRDYFEMSSPALQTVPPKSHPLSTDDAPWSSWRGSANVPAAAVGVPASKVIPNLSRSSTTSLDPPSASSSSKPPSSGQRSRRPSPVHEENMLPGSRSASFVLREDRPIARAGKYSAHEQRPSLRVVPVEGDAPRLNESRAVPRAGPPLIEFPRPVTRAYSHSSTSDETVRPSTSHRTFSTNYIPSPTNGPPVLQPISRTVIYSIPPSQTTPLPPRPEPAPSNLPPCPRAVPTAGHRDWYTVAQVPEIDICPACMETLGNSRFRDIFVPSLAKLPTKEVRCAMSRPWLRIAWIQLVKQRRSAQEMTKLVYDLTHLPANTKPCPGKAVQSRVWYHLIDPLDGSPVPNFEACTNCVRNVDLVFPQLNGIFKRTTTLCQEKVCDLNCHSKRFLGYIDQLDAAATRVEVEKMRKPDIGCLVEHARRTARLKECMRDNMFVSTWHFMPELPDFTVCEECYEGVVRPVLEKPIAKNFHKKARLVPAKRDGDYANARSCQLYSDRMRKIFRDAIRNNNFEVLKQAAVQRHEVEVALQEKHRQMMRETMAGFDRTADMAKNVEIWKTWE